MRAAVMSCTEPGSASETHSGNPPGAITAWMLPPWAVGLAGVPQVDDLAFHADGLLPAPVGGDDLAVQDHVREALVPGPFQRLAQLRGLFGEHRDDLVQVAVGGGPGDAVVAGQRIGGGAVAEPAQPQHRLPEAGQRPAAPRGAAAAPLGQQQLRGELRQFPGDVKRGTIGDHVEPSGRSDLVVRPLLLGLHAHVRAARFVRVSARMSRLGRIKPDCPNLFR